MLNFLCLCDIIDTGQAKTQRGRSSGPLAKRILGLYDKDFKGKPFRKRDRDLLSIEVIKEILHRQSSDLSSHMGNGSLFASNERFYKFLKTS